METIFELFKTCLYFNISLTQKVKTWTISGYSRALRYAALSYAGLDGTRFWIGSKNFRDTRIWDFFLEKRGFLLRLNCKKDFLANRWNDGMAYRSYSIEATLQKLLYRSYSVVIGYLQYKLGSKHHYQVSVYNKVFNGWQLITAEYYRISAVFFAKLPFQC